MTPNAAGLAGASEAPAAPKAPPHPSAAPSAFAGVEARMIESEDDRKAWHEISEKSPAGDMRQCFWWADPLRKPAFAPKASAFGAALAWSEAAFSGRSRFPTSERT